MMIRDVLTIGDPRLLVVSAAISADEFNTSELNSLISDLYDTMKSRDGVGIAAVQIGYHKRVLLIEYDGNNPRYSHIGNCPLHVVINPEIEVIGNETVDYNEGCLSVPEERSVVNRPKFIRYRFFNQYGQLVEGENDGFFARVLQHEVDHLNGVLFPMRIEDPAKLIKI